MLKPLFFLKEFISDPKAVGSLVPSSKALIKKMTHGIESLPVIVELGPGTGAITGGILEQNPPHYFAFEINEKFSSYLKETYGDIQIINDDAAKLADYLGDHFGKVDMIISSLPFTSLPRESALKILESCAGALKPGGLFRTYLYLHTMNLPKNRRFLKDAESFLGKSSREIVMQNFPPAAVFTFTKPIANRE